MNFGYGAAPHRDANNTGLSMLAAFGNFQGGELRYWPDDDKSVGVEKLPSKGSMVIDVRKHLLLFDGQRCHEVLPFKGERYSLVWFTCARYLDAGKANLGKISKLGFEVPTDKAVASVKNALRKPRGCKLASHAELKGPGAMMWPSDRSEVQSCMAKRARCTSAEPEAKRRKTSAAAVGA